MKMLNKQPLRKSRTKHVDEVRDNIENSVGKVDKDRRHTERRVRQNGELVSSGGGSGGGGGGGGG
jgi:uncharacterized membrane protein